MPVEQRTGQPTSETGVRKLVEKVKKVIKKATSVDTTKTFDGGAFNVEETYGGSIVEGEGPFFSFYNGGSCDKETVSVDHVTSIRDFGMIIIGARPQIQSSAARDIQKTADFLRGEGVDPNGVEEFGKIQATVKELKGLIEKVPFIETLRHNRVRTLLQGIKDIASNSDSGDRSPKEKLEYQKKIVEVTGFEMEAVYEKLAKEGKLGDFVLCGTNIFSLGVFIHLAMEAGLAIPLDRVLLMEPTRFSKDISVERNKVTHQIIKETHVGVGIKVNGKLGEGCSPATAIVCATDCQATGVNTIASIKAVEKMLPKFKKSNDSRIVYSDKVNKRTVIGVSVVAALHALNKFHGSIYAIVADVASSYADGNFTLGDTSACLGCGEGKKYLGHMPDWLTELPREFDEAAPWNATIRELREHFLI